MGLPLIVGVSGSQGSGKSTLCRTLEVLLREGHGLNAATLSLDDLYLTVLKPASRKERSPTADLEIPGNQAAVLYPGSDRNLPITRQSLLAGLEYNARAKLALGIARSAQPERVAALANGGSFIKAGFSGSTALAGAGETDGGRSDHEL